MIQPDDERKGAELVKAALDPSYQVTDPAVQLLQLAMTGFGYNFYDAKNAARANDVLVRQKSAEFLNAAAAKAQDLESAYRKIFIPPPSREQPFPSTERSTRAKGLHELAMRLRSLASHIITMSVPQPDAIWSRVRNEVQVLQRLLVFDASLTAATSAIRDMLDAMAAEQCDSDSALADISNALDALERSFAARSKLLAIPTESTPASRTSISP